MRAIHFIRLALIVIWQTAMIACVLYFDSSSHRWIPGAFAVAALLLPFVGYIVACYDAPLFARWSRVLKASVLTVSSVIVTIAGYLGLFMAGLLLEKVRYDDVVA